MERWWQRWWQEGPGWEGVLVKVTPLKALTTGQTGSQCLAWKALGEEAPLRAQTRSVGGVGVAVVPSRALCLRCATRRAG